MSEEISVDVGAVLGKLKRFQRATVDHVCEHLFDANGSRRFLVADEVGLGKTLIARGVIARTIEHLKDSVDRIDVVYICSNADIAAQNVKRLRVSDDEFVNTHTRLTLLPSLVRNLRGRRLNFVSLTPNTSLELTGGLGRMDERALIYCLVREIWGVDSAAVFNVFQGDASYGNFRAAARTRWEEHEAEPLDETITAAFRQHIATRSEHRVAEGGKTLRASFDELCEAFKRHDGKHAQEDRDTRREFVGELRTLLAAACVEALEPDLVILDEFQRFKHLLNAEDESSRLAHQLFDYPAAHLLLLSATPYKMYTNASDEGDDHYEDFVSTVKFLEGSKANSASLREDIRAFRDSLYQLTSNGGEERLKGCANHLESRLRRSMVRTERLAATVDRSGMLKELDVPAVVPTVRELKDYVAVARLAHQLDVPDPLEYWKSSPYLLNLMRDYEVKRAFTAAVSNAPKRVAPLVDPDSLLRRDDIESYADVELRSARLERLSEDTLGDQAWKLLWIPAAMPYTTPAGVFARPGLQDFTKRFVFSSWQVVPRALSTLLSYQAERLLYGEGSRARRYSDKGHTGLLRVKSDATGLSVLTLACPSTRLASLGDPRANAVSGPVDAEVVRQRTRVRIEEALLDVHERVGSLLDGGQDERWYWAAGLILDYVEAPSAVEQWLGQPHLASDVGWGDSEGLVWGDAVREMRSIATGETPLGPMPDDLAEVLARVALSSPAVCAARALTRGRQDEVQDIEVRNAAARVGGAFVSLFTKPMIAALVARSDQPYWRAVLSYCEDGNLQAVLDEYVHMARELYATEQSEPDQEIAELAAKIGDIVSLRVSSQAVDYIDVKDGNVQVEDDSLRTHFALRFGDTKNSDGSMLRQQHVRDAFNSPFWPFVLASTSVGQEGLDFHAYCHRVVHWNLPSNPVDLEQREGRVHRFKGHAVRKNVARRHRIDAMSDFERDPWTAAFRAAERDSGDSEISPYWVYSVPDGAHIERVILNPPLSRDEWRAQDLRRSLAVYRLVFGQPRQDDLLNHLQGRLSDERIQELCDSIRINLTPRSRPDGEHGVVKLSLPHGKSLSELPKHRESERLHSDVGDRAFWRELLASVEATGTKVALPVPLDQPQLRFRFRDSVMVVRRGESALSIVLVFGGGDPEAWGAFVREQRAELCGGLDWKWEFGGQHTYVRAMLPAGGVGDTSKMLSRLLEELQACLAELAEAKIREDSLLHTLLDV